MAFYCPNTWTTNTYFSMGPYWLSMYVLYTGYLPFHHLILWKCTEDKEGRFQMCKLEVNRLLKRMLELNPTYGEVHHVRLMLVGRDLKEPLR